MFAMRERKQQTGGLAPSRHTQALRARTAGTRSPDSLPDPTYFLQRYLGNSYMQTVAEEGHTRSDVLTLQRACACGGTCASCAGQDYEIEQMQPKLIVGQPGDVYEREADHVAEAVMHLPELPMPQDAAMSGELQGLRPQYLPTKGHDTLRRQPLKEEAEEEEDPLPLQAKECSANSPVVTPDFTSRIHDLHGGGEPLPAATRAFFEPRFGYDFSPVRVHTDVRAAAAARVLHARAFTVGFDIVFGAGQHAPGTTEGRRLLAHELTHVVQQHSRERQRSQARGEENHGSTAPERTAEMMGAGGIHGASIGVSRVRSDGSVRHGLGQARVARRNAGVRGNSEKGRLNFLYTLGQMRFRQGVDRSRSDVKPGVAKASRMAPAESHNSSATHAGIDSSLWHKLATHVHRGRDTKPPPSGGPLDGDVRARLEHGFGTRLGGIVVHDDAAAHDFVSRRRAQAVTIGNHIYLSEARRDPERGGNFRVLAHEVAHTLQQGSANAETGISDPQLKQRLELEADTAALRVAAGEQTQVSSRQIGPTPQHLDEPGANSSANVDPSQSEEDTYSTGELMAQGEQLLGRLQEMEADTLSMPADVVERINANYAQLREEVGNLVPLPDEVLKAAPGSYFVPPPVAAPAVVVVVIVIEIPLWVVIAIVAALVVFALLVLAILGYAAYQLIKWIFDDVEEAVDAPPLQTQPELEPTAGSRQKRNQRGFDESEERSAKETQRPGSDADEDQKEQRRCCCQVIGGPHIELVGRIDDRRSAETAMMGHWFRVSFDLANRLAAKGEPASECRYIWTEREAGSLDVRNGDTDPDLEGWRRRVTAAEDPTCSWSGRVTDEDLPSVPLRDRRNSARSIVFDVRAYSGCDETSFGFGGRQLLIADQHTMPLEEAMTPIWIDRHGTQRSYLDMNDNRLDPEPYAGPNFLNDVVEERFRRRG